MPETNSKFRTVNCKGVMGGDAYLIRAKGANILVDSGFGFSADEMLKKIKSELKEENLDFVLLTHSHYDHALGSAKIKTVYPEAKIVAGRYCHEVFLRPTAKAAMRKMDISASEVYGFAPGEDITDNLQVDIIADDGDTLKLGEHEVKVIGLPGHTKCSVGFYFVKEKFLVSCETLGVYSEDLVIPACLVGYEMTMDSIKKVRSLEIEEILIPHFGILIGDKVQEYLKASEKCTEECKDLIVNAHKNGADFDELVKLFKKHYYSPQTAKSYPEPALMANLRAQIPLFIKECSD